MGTKFVVTRGFELYLHNIKAHALYSGILGAFLEQSDDNSDNTNNDPIHDETLQQAAA